MRTARLARFGRWTFYAGWILGITFANFADLFDWPWWVIAAVAFGTACAVRWFMDRVAKRAAELTPGEVKP